MAMEMMQTKRARNYRLSPKAKGGKNTMRPRAPWPISPLQGHRGSGGDRSKAGNGPQSAWVTHMPPFPPPPTPPPKVAGAGPLGCLAAVPLRERARRSSPGDQGMG